MASMHNSQETAAEPAFRGGRRAAEARLALIDPARYAATRNHLDGAVTRLSPYIRHGVLTLAEVREAVFDRLRQLQPPPSAAQGDLLGTEGEAQGWSPAQRRVGEKLINELGWRDYWQRLWLQLGDGIWEDREPLKTGHRPDSYAPELPGDLASAATGLACIDGFASELMDTGWLHNHARMWLASYVVHWRRVRWQAGARWFLSHLLDGDPASNNLSWQWVASSFSHKPYLFNRANLERFSSQRYCQGCPKAQGGGATSPEGCPFETSYEHLQARLFRPMGWRSESARPAAATANPAAVASAGPWRSPPPPSQPLIWVHGEALGPSNPALKAHPGAPAVFVFDTELLSGRAASSGGHPAVGGAPQPLAAGRLRFLRECLAELPTELREGEVASELLAAAAARGCDGIVTSRAVDPRFGLIATRLASALPLQILEPEPFVELPLQGPGSPDLGRFSRYWRRAEPRVWEGGSSSA
ncbi:MAG: FAD-binding domain-containing protein [Cyanobacteriota bacterium]